MSHHHERQLCRCGAVIMQCRCIEPKTDRVVTPWCARCRPLDGTTSRPAAATPPTLSRREKIELLGRENSIVGHALGMHRFHAVPWTEALEEMVLYLARADAEKMKLLIEAARNAPPPPIVIQCRTECLLRKVAQ
jgi:hypothetical protein